MVYGTTLLPLYETSRGLTTMVYGTTLLPLYETS